MEEIKKYWEQFFGNTPLPPRAELCKEIIIHGEQYQRRYNEIFQAIQEHRIKIDVELNQVELLRNLSETTLKLMETLCQFRNLLECVPHSLKDKERLNSLIGSVHCDYERFCTKTESVEKDLYIFLSSLDFLQGVDGAHFIAAPHSYYQNYRKNYHN